jgi:hypothetical protein
MDWRAAQIRDACISVIAVALCLFSGMIAASPQLGMAATTGALSIGFGAAHRLANTPGLAMLVAAFGMGVCAFLGVILGHSPLAAALAGGLVAMACGIATQFGQASWWFTLQWSIAFFLAMAMPGGLQSATERAALVLAGGLLQLGIRVVSWRWIGSGTAARLRPSDFIRSLPTVVALTLPPTSVSSSQLSYALIAGAMTAIAIFVERALKIPNGYWIPMTALIILRPQVHDAATLTVQRIAGTLAAAGAATLIAASIRPSGIVLVMTVIVLTWCTYAFQRVSYAVFSFGITAAVVFLLAIAGLPEPVAAAHRIIATVIGALLAVLAGSIIETCGGRARHEEEGS